MIIVRIAPNGAVWRRSSNDSGGNCLEVASLPDGLVGIRDSKLDDATGPVVTVAAADWATFQHQLQHGETFAA